MAIWLCPGQWEVFFKTSRKTPIKGWNVSCIFSSLFLPIRIWIQWLESQQLSWTLRQHIKDRETPVKRSLSPWWPWRIYRRCYNKLNSGISFMLKRETNFSLILRLLFGTFLLCAPEPLLSHMCHLLILYFTPSLFHYPVCWMTESNFRQIPTPTKNTTIKNIWGVKKKEKEPSYTVGPNVSWKELWKFLKKLKTELPYDPATQFLGIFLKKILIWTDTFTPMFTAALFRIAKTWKQPKCPLTEEWIKTWHMWWNITQP